VRAEELRDGALEAVQYAGLLKLTWFTGSESSRIELS
jgi:hypothetical protein